MRLSLLLSFLLLVKLGFAQPVKQPVSLSDPAFNIYFFKTSPPIIKGKIVNFTNNDLPALQVSYSLVEPMGQMQQEGTTAIKADGSFEVKLPYPFPYQQVWLSVGDYFYAGLYLNRGLNLTLDFAQLKKKNVQFNGKGVMYSGNDGALTAWMNNKVLYKRKDQLAIGSAIQALKPTQADYLSKLDSLSDLLKTVNQEYVKLNPAPFSWIPENERLSDYYHTLLWFWMPEHATPGLWDKIKSHKPKLVSNDAENFANALFNYAYYRKAEHNDAKFAELMGMPAADRLFLKSTARNLDENVQIQKSILSKIHTPWVKSVVENEQRLTLSKLSKLNEALKKSSDVSADSVIGTPVARFAFGATLSSVKGMKAAEFLGKFAQRFKGKAVVCDLWATWCAPCLGDMPYSAKLHTQAAGLPIEFVYLCTADGSTLERWKTKVIELKQPGTHIFIDKNLSSELMAMLGKGGYPSYFCLDQNSKISHKLNIAWMQSLTVQDLQKLVP
ncbi:TlpA disulfide reductase family protein [Mucilaginibacter sp. CSA2-8R]|uniref:TlpA family protein disulfide reductase n=1 Tax=Mucilaginibacter sp. CSA2-8R TaxID=3141542 RepID=UPI00315D5963